MSRIIPVVAIIATIFVVDTLAMQCLTGKSETSLGKKAGGLFSDCPRPWTLPRDKKYCCLSLWSFKMDCCNGKDFGMNLLTAYLPVFLVFLLILIVPIGIVVCLCRRCC